MRGRRFSPAEDSGRWFRSKATSPARCARSCGRLCRRAALRRAALWVASSLTASTTSSAGRHFHLPRRRRPGRPLSSIQGTNKPRVPPSPHQLPGGFKRQVHHSAISSLSNATIMRVGQCIFSMSSGFQFMWKGCRLKRNGCSFLSTKLHF